jgi:dTDP-4-dehydrorhamnose reductase
MIVLITGANGFLGHYLIAEMLAADYTIIATGKGPGRLPVIANSNFIYEEMDFTDPYQVHDIFEKYQPSIVVHAGAMSKPDDCEKEQWQAYVTNVEGTLNLLVNAEESKSHFVFISTDFVFSGESGMYREEDETGPVNFYGKTKLEAEEAVQEYAYNWTIIRTVLVYGKPQAGRGNILTVVKDKLEKGEEYNVFDDQVRTPTYVEDLAKAITEVISRKATGIFHISGEDVLTPYEMACMTAEYLGYDKTKIKKVTASEFPQPARRPLKTGFNIEKARKKLGFFPTSFREGLVKTFS